MSKYERLALLMVVLVLGLVVVQPGFGQEKPEIKRIQAFVYSTSNESQREAEIQELLNANPQLANATTTDGLSIFTWAISNLGTDDDMDRKSRKLAEMLVEKGADVNVVDKHGTPILIKFAMFAQIPQMEFMISHGVKVDAKDKEDGRTALHWVALLKEFEDGAPQAREQVDGYLQAAELLLTAKANINAKDIRGNTPLHSTTFLGNIRMAELLVKNGADINAKNSDGETPLAMVQGRLKETWANEKEKKVLPAVIEFLEKHGGR